MTDLATYVRSLPIAALNKQWSEMVMFLVRAANRAILPVLCRDPDTSPASCGNGASGNSQQCAHRHRGQFSRTLRCRNTQRGRHRMRSASATPTKICAVCTKPASSPGRTLSATRVRDGIPRRIGVAATTGNTTDGSMISEAQRRIGKVCRKSQHQPGPRSALG